MPEPLLQVRDLRVTLSSTILDGLSFEIAAGAITGLCGESGCGKTTLALALLRLLPGKYRVEGSIRLGGQELTGLPERDMRRVRGARIAMIFQDPMLALNPVLRVRGQVRETMRAHGIKRRPEEALELAGLEPSARILRAYAHQLSGGERQRVLIAQALACRPELVIADEPFTALDLPRVVELAALFGELKRNTGSSFLVIGHNPGVLAHLADSVLVMHAGRIVEQGPVRRVFGAPAHPYTRQLVAAARGAESAHG
jgi:ABC-type glutathione transport system ATPase component